jgi:hypothetical protein
LCLRATYAFFDKAAKEDSDLAAMQEAIWFKKLGKSENNYTPREILEAFDDVTTHYKNKLRDPTAAEYEEIILMRRRKAREKAEEAAKKHARQLALQKPKEDIERGKMIARDSCKRMEFICKKFI